MKVNSTALLVMDIQHGIVERYSDSADTISKINTSIQFANRQEIPVIYVMVGFRKGMPEVGATNKTFSASKERMAGIDPKEVMKLHSDLDIDTDDIIVTKHRFSAFSGSDLDMILRSLSIRHLVLCGIATSGVVLSTLREASDKDYLLTVLSDCCTDTDPQAEEVLMRKVFPAQAEVKTTEEWMENE
ncbi:cysteine hydrolase family protein [Pedobacter metabolipauper]|uniref:Nicotinamidase-related amidase n=1 Tax=Pedobacter metabolipauper TaxID=425513 RepID=A0A4R6SZ36_9SPHI|nr:cysteine hydrolase [Pedobacter metabolipauper]TDQ11716.1 nicotinamidase-related amidase [Pedobacter metabolipauper]